MAMDYLFSCTVMISVTNTPIPVLLFSIVFQADQAVVCVVQVRQPDVTVVNLTMSVMHQVLEKHQFMPDVIAIVGEGVLTKNRFGEKQRGKMLSLFMSAKM